MKKIAIILARSGSKGLPDKNIRELKDRPLLAYSVQAALDSGIYDCVHVSTDSKKYADIVRKCGADVPFLRSEETSSDRADSWSVVKEVLQMYESMDSHFNLVTLLQLTSPLRNADAVVSVCEMEHSPIWSNTLSEDLSMDGFIRVGGNVQRQKLSTYYRINGAIYMVKNSFLMEDSNIYRKGCYAFIMDRNHSIDIDSLLDFKMAEFLIGGGYWLTLLRVKSRDNHYHNTPGFRRVYPRHMCAFERRCA